MKSGPVENAVLDHHTYILALQLGSGRLELQVRRCGTLYHLTFGIMYFAECSLNKQQIEIYYTSATRGHMSPIAI